HDGNRARCSHGSSYCVWAGGHNDVAFERHEFPGELGKLVYCSLIETSLNDCGLAVDVACLSQRLQEHTHVLRTGSLKKANPGHVPCPLSLENECRGQDTSTHYGNERSPVLYSITSSARASTEGGMVRPRALAVFRLITSSYLLGCSTGRSAGLAPLRILS